MGILRQCRSTRNGAPSGSVGDFILHSTLISPEHRFFPLPIPCIVDTSMTAILAWVDKGDLCIAADGLASAGRQEDEDIYEWKIARINDQAAIGVASSAWHAWLLFARVLDIPVPVGFPNMSGEWSSIVKLAETRNYFRPDLEFDGISRLIDTYDPTCRPHPDHPFEALVVVASTFDGRPRVTVWDSRRRWTGYGPCIVDVPCIFAPGSDATLEAVYTALRNAGHCSIQKARDCFHLIASEKPHLVNENATMRRASTGFAIEFTYGDGSSNQCRCA